MEDIEIKVTNRINFENAGNPRIVVIGVGGGGCNMISHMARGFKEDNKKADNIKLIAVNTDLQSLNTIEDKNITVIQIGKETAKGLGAGMNPEVGRKSALENYEDIKKAILN